MLLFRSSALLVLLPVLLPIFLLTGCTNNVDVPYEPAITPGMQIQADKISISADGIPIRFSLEVEPGGQFIRLNVFDQRFGGDAVKDANTTRYTVKCKTAQYQSYLMIAYEPSPNPPPKGAENLAQCIQEDAVLDGKTRGISILMGTGNFVGKDALGRDQYQRDNRYAVLLPEIQIPKPKEPATDQSSAADAPRDRQAMLAPTTMDAYKPQTVRFTRRGFSEGGYH